jgi:hypothetical protein
MRPKGPISKYPLPPMDEDRFHELFDILHDGCFEGNWAATARALGVSINTAKKWSKEAPTRYWETNNVLQAIKYIHSLMASSKHKQHRTRAAKIVVQLKRQNLELDAEHLEQNTSAHGEALLHLISTLAWTKLREMSTEELHLAANSGGFSKRILRQAAEQIGLPKETRGFGKDKITWYSIPEP